MDRPRIVIAGTQSGVGKTSVSLAVMASLMRAGRRVQAFKVGPDYIDPSYHGVATGFPSHNLDSWLLSRETVRRLFQDCSEGADISVIEGVMGLYDGLDGKDETASTAQVAKLLDAPVILVVDGSGMARSVAAVVKGYRDFDSEVRIRGVIFNKVGSARHYSLLKEAIEHYTDVSVLGAVFKNQKARIPERHLGLMTAGENSGLKACLDSLVELSKANPEINSPGIDLGRIMKMAKEALPFNAAAQAGPDQRFAVASGDPFGSGNSKKEIKNKVRIGVAQDAAFSFYYQANLDLLSDLGAELVPFSPVSDARLPENCAALYFGGGFPEFFAAELERNQPLKVEIKRRIDEGLPVYAECGGLMYLSQSIETLEGRSFSMVGAVPGTIRMTPRLQNFGYKQGTMLAETILGKSGDAVRGHEFHYSQRIPESSAGPAYELADKRGEKKQLEGYSKGSLLASYLHLNFLANPQWAERFVQSAENYRQRRLLTSAV